MVNVLIVSLRTRLVEVFLRQDCFSQDNFHVEQMVVELERVSEVATKTVSKTMISFHKVGIVCVS